MNISSYVLLLVFICCTSFFSESVNSSQISFGLCLSPFLFPKTAAGDATPTGAAAGRPSAAILVAPELARKFECLDFDMDWPEIMEIGYCG